MNKPLEYRCARLGLTALLMAASFLVPPCAYASEGSLKARVETNIRAGTERTILMTEAWVPLAQERDRVLYGDVRLMGDDGDNREWNFGLGYRGLNAPGDAVLGAHGWFDRRRSTRGSVFHQVAGGVEYLSSDLDVRLNGYIPFNEEERYTIAGGSTTPYLADTGIFYDTNGLLVEKPLHGFDVEFSLPVKALEKTFDSFRVSAGGFVFSGDDVETLRGVRLRAAADVTSDLQIGARFETDNQRGAQAFAEATLRFPFGSKTSNRTLGLRSRLDESPERDIDVITSAKVAVAATQRNAVTSSFDGLEQRVFHVDNTAAAGGDGSLSNPFNTLAAANAAANRPGDVIYLNRGDGTTAGQNQGVTLAHQGQALIGSGVDFIYDGTRFTAAGGTNFSGTLLRAATAAPVITNIGGDGVHIVAADALLAGIDVSGAAGHGVSVFAGGGANLATVALHNLNISNSAGDGLRVEAGGVGSFVDVTVANVIAASNRNGMRFYAHTDASVSGAVEASSATGNVQHGIIAYDDSNAGEVALDLGGGGRSAGLNSLFNNGLEDIAVDLDGATLMARNNWWGQSSGLYQSAPSGGLRPQIYYGAPINDGLVGHWTFDDAWLSTTTVFDRSSFTNNGAYFGGLGIANLVTGPNREALNFAAEQFVRVPDSTTLNILENSVTISGWFNPNVNIADAASRFPILLIKRPWNVGGYAAHFLRDSGNVIVQVCAPVCTPAAGGDFISDQWYHYTGVIDGQQLRLYINGSLISTNTFTGTIGSSAGVPLEIGNNLDARIDDMRVYNRALSSSEISQLYRMDASSGVDNGSFLTSAP